MKALSFHLDERESAKRQSEAEQTNATQTRSRPTFCVSDYITRTRVFLSSRLGPFFLNKSQVQWRGR